MGLIVTFLLVELVITGDLPADYDETFHMLDTTTFVIFAAFLVHVLNE